MSVRVKSHFRRRRKSADILERATFSEKKTFSEEDSKKVARMKTRGGKWVEVFTTVRGGGGTDAKLIGQLPEASGAANYRDEDPKTSVGIRITRSAWKESVAHTLDQLLEFNVIPPTYLRAVEDEKGPRGVAVQKWVPDSKSIYAIRVPLDHRDSRGLNYRTDRLSEGGINKRDFIKIFLFDMLIAHLDRHQGNIVVELQPPYHAWGIDNENIIDASNLGRPATMRNIAYVHGALPFIEGEKIPNAVMQKIRDLQFEDFVTATAGATRAQQELAWKRRDVILTWKTVPTRDWFQHRAGDV